MNKVGIPEERRVSQLTDQEVLQIREVIDHDYMVEGDLRRETAMNIKRLIKTRLLSRVAPSARVAGAGSTHAYQCANP